MSEPLSDSRVLQQRLVRVVEAARKVDIRPFEDASLEHVLAELVPRVERLLADATALTSELCVEGAAVRAVPDPGSRNFDLEIDRRLATAGYEASVSDLAFLGLMELRQRTARIQTSAAGHDAWQLVVECGSALRRIQKALGAIEHLLCELCRMPRLLEWRTELEVSVETRRCYRRLRQLIATAPDPGEDPAAVRGLLRGAGTLIAVIVGRDIYPRLRASDRFQLRGFQVRILTWLADETPDPKNGSRLWQDLSAFGQMLAQVSLRQELVEHDREAVAMLSRVLGSLRPDASLPRHLVQPFRRLEGLDDQLDAALGAEVPTVGEVHQALLRLARRLRPPPSPSASGASHDGDDEVL